MKIDIERLNHDGEIFTGSLAGDILDIPESEHIIPVTPINYNIHAIIIDKELIISGTIDVEIKFRCSRCLEEFIQKYHITNFNYVYNITENAVLDEFMEDQGEKFKHFPESIDLTSDIRESILLAFPNHPVCDSECKGICPQCGINKNKEECNCKPPTDARWDVLNNLKL